MNIERRKWCHIQAGNGVVISKRRDKRQTTEAGHPASPDSASLRLERVLLNGQGGRTASESISRCWKQPGK
ncbi:hypothetical protein ASPZODRAFT_130114 [Penicilliopsis zonata CBS 506.65]|uniref:Uncharacterized protein n=1 Tax=Penicilliopsis zonata CBS 506.65 TaxID=1073090 RepID=A0A1L9SMA3_9EURO|nr:hypothetical protein ASPZODRAFT_130114 [Penicilliopsis zonata CBS 506.65]OJJ48167.1 hypothetical protein ASPZODRAFT_130114 [Penicilliopsis zonata CBS 506.65]